MNWYAIHTKPRQESVAQTSLQREGVETFLPKLRQRRTIRRVRKWVTGPLFPNYLFARFEAAHSSRLVKYANGVTGIVSFGGKPAIVENAIIAAITDHAEADVITIGPPSFKQGDRVEIQEGPLRGLQGIFERELTGTERVAILLQAISSAMRVQVSRASIEKLD